MAETFTGFPAEATEFYADLELDNSREFWLANKDVFERSVKAPMRALLDALDPDPGAFKVFRPNRDVRFSPDKSPYKVQHGAAASAPGGTMRYVHVSADGLFVASGCYVLATDQIARLRAAIADEEAGAALAALLPKVERKGLEVSSGAHAALKTAPRGYPKDHPRIELLRMKGLVAYEQIADPEIVESAAALARIRASWKAAAPMCAWLDEHVGPSTLPPGRFGR